MRTDKELIKLLLNDIKEFPITTGLCFRIEEFHDFDHITTPEYIRLMQIIRDNSPYPKKSLCYFFFTKGDNEIRIEFLENILKKIN